MTSWWYAGDIIKSREELNPLLPHLAGVLENVEEATFHHIKEQIEREIEKTVPDAEVLKALDNGISLGVFVMERGFKVCREFTTKEIKRSKEFNEGMRDEMYDGALTQPDKNLMKYVKNQREQRRNKMYKKGKKSRALFSSKCFKGNSNLYKYLCDKCKKSVDREIVEMQNTDTSSEDDNNNASGASETGSNGSSSSGRSCIGINFSGEIEKPPAKSRLLVEKNPMETDPPYYDIFT